MNIHQTGHYRIKPESQTSVEEAMHRLTLSTPILWVKSNGLIGSTSLPRVQYINSLLIHLTTLVV
jgi:hypothetical protein